MAITELSSPPSLATLYPKAVLSGLRRRGGEVPDTAYALPGVRVDASHLAAYNKVCGFRLADELPATYPHVLTFPLQIKLMAAGDFPFPLAGSVHVANKITQTRPLSLADELELRVHVANLRDHPRGKQFDMISEALVDGDVVWTDTSTYLRRGGGSGAPERKERRAAAGAGPRPRRAGRDPGGGRGGGAAVPARRRGRSGVRCRRRPRAGGCPTTSGGVTARCPATATPSTC